MYYQRCDEIKTSLYPQSNILHIYLRNVSTHGVYLDVTIDTKS